MGIFKTFNRINFFDKLTKIRKGFVIIIKLSMI